MDRGICFKPVWEHRLKGAVFVFAMDSGKSVNNQQMTPRKRYTKNKHLLMNGMAFLTDVADEDDNVLHRASLYWDFGNDFHTGYKL